MDLKTLEETSQAGLEQWRPVMKASFPLGLARRAHRLRRARGAAAGRLRTPSRSTSSWRSSARRGAGCGRWRSTSAAALPINGCMSEMTEVVVDGTPVRTVAIESEDAGRVVEAVRANGPRGLPDISYPRAQGRRRHEG
jgi:exopolyphosphatase/guanosine-5'-triphosphate,3'-diphosphate pyrophosphatase